MTILPLSLWPLLAGWCVSCAHYFLSVFPSRTSQHWDQPDPPGDAWVWCGVGPNGVASTFGGGFSPDFPVPHSPAGCARLLEVGTTRPSLTALSCWLPKPWLKSAYLMLHLLWLEMGRGQIHFFNCPPGEKSSFLNLIEYFVTNPGTLNIMRKIKHVD